MTQNNIIFLDIDGVLNGQYSKIYKKNDEDLDCKKAQLLKELVRKTNSKIVLSSSWKNNWEGTRRRKKLLSFLSRNGLKLYDITITHSGNNYEIIYDDSAVYEKDYDRGQEIIEYINSHKVDNYVILDDIISLGKELDKHLVVTKYYYGNGLSKKDVKKAIKILNGECYD